MLEEILAQVAPVVTELVFFLVVWLLLEGVKYLRSQTKNAVLTHAADALDALVSTVVKALEQTVVSKMKEVSSDGKLTAEDAVEVKRIAMDTIKAQLPAAIRAILESQIKDLEAFIGQKVEAEVLKMKVFGQNPTSQSQSSG